MLENILMTIVVVIFVVVFLIAFFITNIIAVKIREFIMELSGASGMFFSMKKHFSIVGFTAFIIAGMVAALLMELFGIS